MSFNGGSRVPATPTLPQGETVASYSTYLEAQRAVDHLSDRQFPVQNVTIVGTDLKMVERVTGRITYPRVALSGFLSGAWFGLFIGLLFFMTSDSLGILPVAMVVGGGFGLMFGVVSYAFTGGKRDFTSQSQIVANQYAVLCATDKANDARTLLREVGAVQTGATSQPVVPFGAPPATPQPPAQPRPAEPRYGQYAAPVAQQPPVNPAQAQPAAPVQQAAPVAQPAVPAERPVPQYGQYAPAPDQTQQPEAQNPDQPQS